jgi:hypothetical protein
MANYKINSADFATQTGEFDLIGVVGGVIYLASVTKLKKPFASVTDSELPVEIVNALNERENAITAARTAKTAEIDEARNAYISQGVEYNGVIYDADERAQQIITSMISLYGAAGQTDAKISFITKANAVETLTYSDLVQLGAALANRVSEAYLTARTLKNQAENAATLAEIQAIKWTLGENLAQNSENSAENSENLARNSENSAQNA